MPIFPSRDQNSVLARVLTVGAKLGHIPWSQGRVAVCCRVSDTPCLGQAGQNWDRQSEVSVLALLEVHGHSGS